VRIAIALAVALSAVQRPLAQPSTPKLAVILVVDQMRADYIDRFQKDWTGGLKRLVSEGAVFQNAAYPYLTTVTCPGHATIATGTFPRRHGIVQNQWWDRERHASMTCTEDPRAAGVGYRTRIRNGDSPWRLQRPTLTDVMRSQVDAHVVSLSLKDRSAIMLAGHGGNAVTWLSDSLEGWMTSSAFADRPVPAAKSFVDANAISADFGKTWSLLLPAARYAERDDDATEAPPRGWTRTFPHVLNGATDERDAAFFAQWERSPFADEYLGRFAGAMVDAFSLGRHAGTDVLAVSFSAPDFLGHAFGPRSVEVHDLYLRLDRTIGALLDHIDASVGRGQWVAALTADHGVTAIPEQLIAQGQSAGRLTASLVSAAVEARLRDKLGAGKHVASVNTNDVYFVDGVFEKLERSPELLHAVVRAVSEIPGIARVFPSTQLRDPAVATDPEQRAAAIGYFPGRSGDLILVPKPGWMFVGSGTTHGGAHPDDQRVPIIFLGSGIRPGRHQDAVTPADIAPTLAAICGVRLPDVDGRVLGGALIH